MIILILAIWKGDSYDSILFIVDCLIQMIHNKSVKATIDAVALVEVIINIVKQ